jgi:hypothetical protein
VFASFADPAIARLGLGLDGDAVASPQELS